MKITNKTELPPKGELKVTQPAKLTPEQRIDALMAKRAKARELIELKKTTNSAAFRRAHGSYPAWRVLISAYSDHLLATGSAVADVTRIIHAVGHSIEPVPSAATCFTAPGAGRG